MSRQVRSHNKLNETLSELGPFTERIGELATKTASFSSYDVSFGAG
jgi:hypothetical protein